MTAATATILVVDDNAENRALAQATLEDERYRVVLASDGEAGITAFAREQPDCVLLDVRMPGLDGPGTCERMRALPGGADVPIVFMTAQRDVETFDRTVRAGGDDFLTKPFRPLELVARVDAALKLRRLAAERSELYAQVKQQRDDLRRLQLQKEQLVAFVVHDLKNPVHTIALHVELMAADPEASDRTRTSAGKVLEHCRGLAGMISTLLDIARADEGRLVPARERVAVSALVAGVLAGLDARAQRADITLAPTGAAPDVSADPDLLRRVLANLVENALRHGPRGSEICVSAREVDDGVEIRVRDRGPGVPVDQRERVFERFVQGGGTAGGNRGLGLAFCKLAVVAHGGRIWIEDAAPGAAFCVWLAQAA